jgi:hypothetical protein
MTYVSPIERQALIRGILALADFLESNPGVPAPVYASIIVFPPNATDAGGHAEIDVIASRIGSGTETSEYGRHYTASRNFGPVEYRAVFIPDENRGEW